MSFKNWTIMALIAALTLSLVTVVTAQDSTANVEVRVWQNTNDAEQLYISARPEGGSWDTLGTIPLDMAGLNSRETFRYGDILVAVPVAVANESPEKAIEESKFCRYLVEESETWEETIAIEIITCSGESKTVGLLETYSLRGVLKHHDRVVEYSGGVYEEISISWVAPYDLMCGPFTEWMTDSYPVSQVYDCFAEIGVIYVGGAALISSNVLGRMYASNGSGEWAFEATISAEKAVKSIQFYRAEGRRQHFGE